MAIRHSVFTLLSILIYTFTQTQEFSSGSTFFFGWNTHARKIEVIFFHVQLDKWVPLLSNCIPTEYRWIIYSRFARGNACKVSVANKLVSLMCISLREGWCARVQVSQAESHMARMKWTFWAPVSVGVELYERGRVDSRLVPGWCASCNAVCSSADYTLKDVLLLWFLQLFFFLISPSHSLSPPDCIGIDCNLSKCSLFFIQEMLLFKRLFFLQFCLSLTS